MFAAAARKKLAEDTDDSGDSGTVVKKRASRTGVKRSSERRKQKEEANEPGDESVSESETEENVDVGDGESITSMSVGDTKKKPRRTRKKGVPDFLSWFGFCAYFLAFSHYCENPVPEVQVKYL